MRGTIPVSRPMLRSTSTGLMCGDHSMQMSTGGGVSASELVFPAAGYCPFFFFFFSLSSCRVNDAILYCYSDSILRTYNFTVFSVLPIYSKLIKAGLRIWIYRSVPLVPFHLYHMTAKIPPALEN